MNSMEVVVVERSRLADILRGVGSADGAAISGLEGELVRELRPNTVGVGYCDGRVAGLPHFVVIPGTDRREFFAWVNTFCPFVTPLSQWCRAVTQRELLDAQRARSRPEYGGTVAAWAGAMIGEDVLHMRGTEKLGQLSTTALHTCVTFVAARAFGLWENRKTRSAAVERLRMMREMLGGADRGMPWSDYDKVWRVLEALSSGKGGVRQGGLWDRDVTVAACMDIQRSGFVSRATMRNILEQLRWPEEYLAYEEAGAEGRLRIFDAASECLEGMRENARGLEELAEFAVAYFAARIGGEASGRIGLVEKIVGRRPMVAIWYGVASALYRPEVWGTEYGGLGRLAIRELNYPWRFGDPPRCDIAVDELVALVEPGRRDRALRFRGAMRKVVEVEVVLGVNGAVSLVGGGEHEADAAGLEGIRGDLVELNRHLAAATESAERLNEAYRKTEAGKNGSRSGSGKRPRRARAGERRGGAGGERR